MRTNRFSARCATCGETVAPGAGTVNSVEGTHLVTHAQCALVARAGRTFTVRRIEHGVETFAEETALGSPRRRFPLVSAIVLVLVVVSLSLVVGRSGSRPAQAEDSSVSTEPATDEAATDVASVIETRAALAGGLPTAPPTTEPAVTAAPEPAPRVNELLPTPTEPPTTTVPATTTRVAPPPTAPPPTAPPPTAPPTTVRATTTVRPTTTVRATTTTTRPPTTTRASKKSNDD